jgi:hypothetical protein
MSAEAARVDDPFRNALMIEMKDFLAKMKVFQRGWTARPDSKGVLIVSDWYSLLSGKDWNLVTRNLVSFPTLSSHDFLVA